MTRADEIQLQLDHHFETELGIAVISMDESRWACIGDLGPYEQVGWAFPVATNPEDRPGDFHTKALNFWADEYLASWQNPSQPMPMVFVYSPDVVALSTAQLDDHDLSRYLICVEYMVDRYVALRLLVPDPAERVRQVESDLYGIGEGALDIVTTVQMANLPPAVNS